MNEEILYKQLKNLVSEINSVNSNQKLTFQRQQKITKNMSLLGGNGRLYIQPSRDGYDISLSGKSLQHQMYNFMRDLCGKECDGYKQCNSRIGKKDQPFWRVEDFSLVKKAAYHYAST